MRHPLGSLYAALLLACLPWGVTASEGVGLFSADAGAAPLLSPAQPSWSPLSELAGSGGAAHGGAFAELPASGELRSRSARMDVGRLSAARRDVERAGPVRLNLNLFADAEFEAVMERTAPTASGYTLTGRLAGDPLSMVVVAVNGEHAAGTVWSSRGVHSIRARDGVAVVRQLDPAAGGRCGVGEASPDKSPLSPSHGSNSTTSKPLSAVPSQTINSPSPPRAAAALSVMPRTDNGHPPDDGSVIDVLLVYPPQARKIEGGHRAMRALIDRDIAMANEAYRTSGAAQRIALVAAVEIDFPLPKPYLDGNESINMVFKLMFKSDGHMDEVHALRDSYAADLVHLYLGSSIYAVPGLGSRAFLLNRENVQEASEIAAFGISHASLTLAHELGHNMGLHHDRSDINRNRIDPYSAPPSLPFHSYGYGYLAHSPSNEFPWATIMANGGLEVPRFSTPRQKYPDESGVPLGVPGDEWTTSVDGPADAVRSLNDTRRLVANYRASAAHCTYALSPPPPDVSAAGGVYRVRVEAPPGCAWSARADGDGSAVVTSGANGSGAGEVAYQVLANEDLEREAAILVAGEVYPVRQAAGRTVESICEREPSIRQAILAAVGKRGCEDVAATDLASIRGLRLRLKDGDLTVLPHRAFDGLTNLRSLFIVDNNLREIERGAFQGLTNLRKLYLEGNNLSEIKRGAFQGLTNLHWLFLNDNNIGKIERGAFQGLTKLGYLSLSGNPLVLKAGMFAGLSGLETLELIGGGIAKLDPNTFEGLSNLSELRLNDNALETLRPGVFTGLSSLTHLRLQNNKLRMLARGALEGLSELLYLFLDDNRLAELEPGALQGPTNLGVFLGGNRLTTLNRGTFDGLNDQISGLFLDRNGITALYPNLFDGIRGGLEVLSLQDNRLTILKPGTFSDMPSLRYLNLDGNRLRELDRSVFGGDRLTLKWLHLGRNNLTSLTPGLVDILRGTKSFDGESTLINLQVDANQLESLPPGLFEGLAGLLKLDLRRNPGAPFALMANLVALPAAGAGSSRPNAVAAEVAEGAPFDMTVKLSAAGAVLSASEVLIPKGATRSAPVSVAPTGTNPVTIRLGLEHDAPIDQCDEGQWRTLGLICYGGIRAFPGPPLVLYGLPDQTLPLDGTVNLHLRSAFPDFPEGTTFTAELSNPVAEAVVEGGTLRVSWAGGGAATVTVAATGPDGRRGTRRFEVRALAPPEAVGGISNLSVVAGESTRVAVSDKFRDSDGGLLTYAAESSDPTVVSVSVDGGVVGVAGREPGAATVTLTATDPDGLSATLTFRVTVVRDINSYWGGWRSVLLKSPSSADGDES